jgi:anti-sigma B factor antagonist
MMQLKERQLGEVTLVHVGGTIIAEDGETLKNAIGRLVEDGRRHIVLDLGELTYVDSAALGNLVASQIRAGRMGSRLKLANAGTRLQDLLVLTRLVTVFDAYDSIDDAIESFT